jgi:thioredoxin 1
MVSPENIMVKQKLHGADMKVIRFTASWCQPCKIMKTMLDEIKPTVPFEVVDIDVNPEVAADYGIRSIPTLIMLDEKSEVKRLSGIKTKEQLTEWLNA